MEELRDFAERIGKFYPTYGRAELWCEFPDILETLWNDETPRETFTDENMHWYFTYTGKDLSLEIMVGGSIRPSIYNICYKGVKYPEKYHPVTAEAAQTMIDKIRNTIYNEVQPQSVNVNTQDTYVDDVYDTDTMDDPITEDNSEYSDDEVYSESGDDETKSESE